MKAYQKVSKEFVRFTVLEETGKLLNRRCFDLGFIPFQSPLIDNTIKLFDQPFLKQKFVKENNQVRKDGASMAQLNENTKLSELELLGGEEQNYFIPVLLKNSLLKISKMEEELNQGDV